MRDIKMPTIRRNAFKKIASILANAKGVIARSSHMRIDDSYDSAYGVSTTETAMTWLKDHQGEAQVYLHENTLRIGGAYHFSREFVIYLDEAEFEEDKARYIEQEEQIAAVVSTEQPTAVTDDAALVVADKITEDQPESLAPTAANDDHYELISANDDAYEIKHSRAGGDIVALTDGGFELVAHGHRMKLFFDRDCGLWKMQLENAMTRKPIPMGIKTFNSLADLEREYQIWRGISQLVTGMNTNAH